MGREGEPRTGPRPRTSWRLRAPEGRSSALRPFRQAPPKGRGGRPLPTAYPNSVSCASSGQRSCTMKPPSTSTQQADQTVETTDQCPGSTEPHISCLQSACSCLPEWHPPAAPRLLRGEAPKGGGCLPPATVGDGGEWRTGLPLPWKSQARCWVPGLPSQSRATSAKPRPRRLFTLLSLSRPKQGGLQAGPRPHTSSEAWRQAPGTLQKTSKFLHLVEKEMFRKEPRGRATGRAALSQTTRVSRKSGERGRGGLRSCLHRSPAIRGQTLGLLG